MRDKTGRDPSFGITRFLPVHGDDVLPEPMIAALGKGASREIDLLIGTTSGGGQSVLRARRHSRQARPLGFAFFLRRALPRAREALRAYGLDRKGEKPGHVLTRALTDLMFRWMARRTAELHHGRVLRL